MSNPTPILRSDWPEDSDRPGSAVPAPARMGLDDVLYDALDAPLEFYVKTFSATEDLPLDFVDQAAVQCRLTKARARHWIAVREARKQADSFQIVLPFMPASLHKLISERTVVSHRSLHAIIAGVVAGMAEIKRLLKRPHGNLKPTNILLRSRKMKSHAVALTDPAPTMRALERGEAGDLRRLGEMIHLMVLHRLPRGPADWPVAPSREWRQLGRFGERWRDLCTRLTNPKGPTVSLEDVERFLRRMTSPAKLAQRGVLTVAALTAAAGGVMLYRAANAPHPAPTIAVVQPTPPRPIPAPQPAVFKNPAPIVTVPKAPAPPPMDPRIVRQLVGDTAIEFQRAAIDAFAVADGLKTQWLQERRERVIARFIDDCSRPAVTALPEIAAAIDERNKRFADDVTRDPSHYGPALISQRETAVRRLLMADRVLKNLPEAAVPKSATPLGQQVTRPLIRACEQARNTAILKAIQLAGQDDLTDDHRIAQTKGQVNQTAAIQSEAASRIREIDRVVQRLGEGYTPDAAPDGEPMHDVVARWSVSRFSADEEYKNAVNSLAVAMAQKDPGVLRLAAASKDELLGLRLAAWQSPLYPIPAKRSDLQADITTRDALLNDTAKVKGADRLIHASFDQRWAAFLGHPPAANDVGYALSAQVRPATADTAQLPADAKWNVQWLELRNLTAANHNSETLPKIHALITDLLHSGAALPAGTVRPELLASLRDWNESPAAEDLSHIGPASADAAVRWVAEPDANGSSITYRVSTGTDPLVFRRVTAASGDLYLCTTETSLGVFADVLSSGNRWREVRDSKLLGEAPVVGPRVWQWSPRRDAGIARSLVWLSSDWVPPGADDYPESIGGEFNRAILRPQRGDSAEAVNPSRKQPIQQISAEFAVYFAKLIGCRLPTPQEWKIAYTSSNQQSRGTNLRDKTWRLELEHMRRSWPRGDGNTYRPDAGMFVPAGEGRSDEIWRSANNEEYDDGTLWFREVVSAAGDAQEFQNLAGNVAEFVRDLSGKIYVIGGSAMSPPTRPLDKEFELPATDRRRGFADVGFRLAFSAPPKPLQRLAKILPAGDEGFILARK